MPYAREILALEAAAYAALGRGNITATGTLRFTASSTFAQLYITPLLPEFLALHPGISLDLRLTDMEFDLIQGSFDLALRNAVLPDSSLKARKLADDTRILCASPDYLHRQGTPTHPDQLADHQLISFKSASPTPLIGRDGTRAQFNPRIAGSRLVIDDGLSQKRATMAGAGISMNALWSVSAELADGSLLRVLTDYRVASQTALWLVYPKANVLTAKVRIFIDFLLQRLSGLPVWDEL